jgi:NinG protein
MVYSTIRAKVGQCNFAGCSYYGQLTKGQCPTHYWYGIRMKSAEKFVEREIKEEGLQDLITDLDVLVSKWVRYSAVGPDNLVQCYTCPSKLPPAEMDAGHYISRASMFLRWDVTRNLRPQCQPCNRSKYGKAAVFGKKLEFEMPGVTEILLEESRIIVKWSREELRGMIADFTQKLKTLNLK